MRTYVAVLLDESGSMSAVRDVTIDGFNEQVETIRKETEGDNETYVSLITFGGSEVRKEFINENVNMLDKVERDSYNPNGNTPLLDAIGESVDRLEEDTDIESEENRYLIIIMTDGMENASQNYSHEEVANKIKSLKENGNWTFTFMGDIQNIEDVTGGLNIDIGNVSKYDSTEIGTREGFKTISASTSDYLRSKNRYADSFYETEDTESGRVENSNNEDN